MNIPRIRITVLKLAVIAFFFVFTIELCARFDDAVTYGAPFFSEYSVKILKSIDKEGIPYNLPNAGFEKWKHNRFGFRGPEIQTRKPDGMIRVVCLGASESYGLFESPDREWPAQLRDLLPRGRFQVINASVAGLGMQQYQPYLIKHVLPLDPDIVLLYINPLFYAAHIETTAQEQIPITKISAKNDNSESQAPHDAFRMRCFPKARQLVKQAICGSFPDLFKRFQRVTLQQQLVSIERMKLKGMRPRDTVSNYCLFKFKSDLRMLVKFLRSKGIKVVLCTYPALMGSSNLNAYPEIFLDNRKYFIQFSLAGMLDTLERFNKAVRNTAVEEEAGFVDASALLPKNTKYFSDNVHYTDTGARVIAKSIAMEIRKDGTP